MRTPLVRGGIDEKYNKGGHRFVIVYTEMLYQVARDYPGIDPRTLKASDIRFYYEGLRAELKRHTSK